MWISILLLVIIKSVEKNLTKFTKINILVNVLINFVINKILLVKISFYIKNKTKLYAIFLKKNHNYWLYYIKTEVTRIKYKNYIKRN